MLDARSLVAVSLLALPLFSADAQSRRRPSANPDGPPPMSVTELLDARRDLDLTPRQVVRLDSLERVLFARRGEVRKRMQLVRDSVCANKPSCELSPDERAKLGELMRNSPSGPQALWRADSAGSAVAMSMLDSTQRGRVQGWRMGQRQALMGRGFGSGGFGPSRGATTRRGWMDRRGFDSDFGGPGFGPGAGRRGDMGSGRPWFGGPNEGLGPRGDRRGRMRPRPDDDDPRPAPPPPRVKPDSLPEIPQP